MGAEPDHPQFDSITLTPSTLARWTTRGNWRLYPHIELIETAVMDLLFEDNHDVLVLSVPPQYGKSEYISGWLVKWIMGHFPRKRLALVSYAAKVAKRWGESARNFFQQHGRELFGLDVSVSKKAADNWIFDNACFESLEESDQWNAEGGYQPGSMVTTGTAGALTGQPVDFGIIDDPIRNARDAASEAFREKLVQWYGTVFLTRLSKGAKHIVIATRWHDGDLSGFIKNNAGGHRVRVLNMAAICPEDDEIAEEDYADFFPDPLGRKAGEVLCPDLHPPEQVLQQRSTLSDYDFWALYQGCPRPGRGGSIKLANLKFYEPHETLLTHDRKNDRWEYPGGGRRYDEVIQSWDTKFSRKANPKRKGSYVVGQVWGRIGTSCYLLHQVRGRWSVDETVEQFRKVALQFPMATTKLVEPKASGPEIVERLEGSMLGLTLWPVDGDKLTRALAQEHWFVGGHIWLPFKHCAPWVSGYIFELRGFPKSTTDDQVDATTQALHYFWTQINNGSVAERCDQVPARNKIGIRIESHQG